MKKIVVFLFLAFFFALGTTFPDRCLAFTPLRVAVLPVLNSSYTYDRDTEQVIGEALQARFRMPLTKVVTIYDLIPASQIQMALPADLKDRSKPDKITAATLQEMAAKLNADFIIGAQITDFRAITSTNFRGDLIQQTKLTIRVVGYDAAKKEFLDIQDSRDYNGDWSVLGNSDYLAKQIMEHLMAKVPYTWKQ